MKKQIISHLVEVSYYFLISLGRPLKIVLEKDLSEVHACLIAEGFYARFRKCVDEILRERRFELESRNSLEGLRNGLSHFEILLGLEQKNTLRTLCSPKFKKSIAFSFHKQSPIIFPLAKHFRLKLSSALGIHFNNPLCGALYFIFGFASYLKAFLRIPSILLRFSAEGHLKDLPPKDRKYAYIASLPKESFPLTFQESHNFIDWISDQFNGQLNIIHDNSSIQNSITLNLDNQLLHRSQILRYLNPKDIFFSFFNLIALLLWSTKRPKIFHASLCQIDELLLCELLVRVKKFLLIDYMIFPNSVSIQKPLWGTWAEKNQTKVIFVHYSANAEPTESFGMRLRDGVWNLSSWAESWVVDETQTILSRKLSPHFSRTFKEVGVPYWAGKRFDLEPVNSRFVISVFDTYIRTNTTFSASTIDDLGWNDFKYEYTFINEILGCIDPNSTLVLHKRKRPVRDFDSENREKYRVKLYNNFLNCYLELDEDFSPQSIIEVSHLVICKPFSTTAFIAREKNKAVVFFDPSGNLNKTDIALRGIEVISDSLSLKRKIYSAQKKSSNA